MSRKFPYELTLSYICRLTSCHLSPWWCLVFQKCYINCGFQDITLLCHISMYLTCYFSHGRSFFFSVPLLCSKLFYEVNCIPTFLSPLKYHIFWSLPWLSPLPCTPAECYCLPQLYFIVHILLYCVIGLYIGLLPYNVNILRKYRI